MKLSGFVLSLSFVALFGTSVLAQEEYYQPDVDSAWVASQNGGQPLESEEQPAEAAPACIGDGCDGTETAAEPVSSEQTAEQESSGGESGSEPSATESAEAASPADSSTTDSTTQATADSTKKDSAQVKTAANKPIDPDEYEDCTEADSTNTECIEIDETDTYDRYLQENAEMYRSRKEGFSRSIQIGIRAAGGINTFFGKKSDDWGFGYQAGGGILVRLPVGIRHVSLVPELDFVYRNYNYESKNEYSKTEGSLDYMLFEIPIIVRYTFDEDNFFVGLGMNLDLKLTGSSEITQKTKETGEKDKRKNTLPSSGVELGGVFNVGYAINRWLIADIRVVQCFTNLLNEDAIAESSLAHAHLYTFYTSLGLTFVF